MSSKVGVFDSLLVGGLVGGAAGIRTSRTFTNAEIKSLPTGAIEIVAAPGAGRILWFHRAIMLFKSGAVAYTNINTTSCSVALCYTGATTMSTYMPNDSSLVELTYVTNFLGSTGGVIWQFHPWTGDYGSFNEWGPIDYVLDMTANANKGFSLFIDNNGSGNLTGGHANNSIVVAVDYSVLTVP